MKNRALRRHHDERAKRRVAVSQGGSARHDPKRVGRLAATRAPCSCWMCGNPRHYAGELTVQERRAAIDLVDEDVWSA